MIKLGTGSLI